MPGLAVIIGEGRDAEQQQALSEMLSTMRHEIFYVSDVLCCPEIGVWAGCIAHQGSFSSRVSKYRHPDGSAVLFNGECFERLPGQSRAPLADPESFAAALIEGARAFGTDYLAKLNGLFSAVLVDRTLNRTMVFNDRFGSERLYAAERPNHRVLASELKAVLATQAATRRLDHAAVAQWLKCGCVIGGKTLFADIQLLPGATVTVCERRRIRSHREYFDRKEWEDQAPISTKDIGGVLAETLREVVPEYVTGEGSVGFAITGGLDTRMIAAAMPREFSDVRTYTYGAPGHETLDQSIGGTIANLCGYPHRSILLSDAWFRAFADYIDQTIWITDGCAGATTAHEIFFTRQSRALSDVRLTGNFGSELLRGVSMLNAWRPAPGFLAHDFRRQYEEAGSPDPDIHPVSRAAFQEIPWLLFGSLAAGRSQVTFRTPYLDNRVVRLAYQLPESHRGSPNASVAAVSILRPELMTVPTDRNVSAGRRGVGGFLRRGSANVLFKLDYWDKEGLPDTLRSLEPILRLLRTTPLLGRHKYLAYRTWFRDKLAGVARHVAGQSKDLECFVDSNFMQTMSERHVSGQQNLLREINAVLTLEAIQRLFLRDTLSGKCRPLSEDRDQ